MSSASTSFRRQAASLQWKDTRPVVFFSSKASETEVPFEADPSNFPEPQFWVPHDQRSPVRDIFRVDNTMWWGQRRLLRNNRTDPSRDLNFTPLDWVNHKSPFRRLRHMLNLFHSSTFQRLAFPELTSVAFISAGLAYYNEFILPAEEMISISSAPFGAATTALGILAGFRLNASYGRFEECRIFWGDTNNTIRDLARQTMMWMKDPLQQKRMLKLCKAYPVVLNFHLSAKGGHHNIDRKNIENSHSFHDRVHSEFLAELGAIYDDGNDMTDFQRLAKVKYNHGNTIIEVLTLMGETIAGSVGTVNAVYVREMDEQCQRLCASMGAAERVLRTSLPNSFTRHTSRLMWMWSNALPFALYSTCGPIGVLPASCFASWAIQSIEDIGIQIEEPFFVLPMRQYSDGMYGVINQIERNYTKYIPPGVDPKEMEKLI